MDYRQLDGTSTTSATDNPMTDQKQAPEAFRRYYDHGLNFTDPSGYYVAYADYEALAKQRDELAGTIETLKGLTRSQACGYSKMMVERDELAKDLREAEDRANKFATKEMHTEKRALKAEAERDQALAESAAREIAMRDRAAEVTVYEGLRFDGKPCYYHIPDKVKAAIRALQPSPDGQQALDDVRAEEWDAGYHGGKYNFPQDSNPHRKTGGK